MQGLLETQDETGKPAERGGGFLPHDDGRKTAILCPVTLIAVCVRYSDVK